MVNLELVITTHEIFRDTELHTFSFKPVANSDSGTNEPNDIIDIGSFVNVNGIFRPKEDIQYFSILNNLCVKADDYKERFGEVEVLYKNPSKKVIKLDLSEIKDLTLGYNVKIPFSNRNELDEFAKKNGFKKGILAITLGISEAYTALKRGEEYISLLDGEPSIKA